MARPLIIIIPPTVAATLLTLFKVPKTQPRHHQPTHRRALFRCVGRPFREIRVFFTFLLSDKIDLARRTAINNAFRLNLVIPGEQFEHLFFFFGKLPAISFELELRER